MILVINTIFHINVMYFSYFIKNKCSHVQKNQTKDTEYEFKSI